MLILTIQCRFIAHSYTGVRHDRAQRDVIDWPPAPARLHQGFIASTLANLPESKREEFAGKTIEALRWLETLPPPEIIATKLAEEDKKYRRALNVAMPHNSQAKGDFARYHSDLAPVLRATPDHNGPLCVTYRWIDDTADFREKAQVHLPALHEAAAKLRYLGRAEDRVECEILWHTSGSSEVIHDSQEIWRPSCQTEDISLLTARSNSTDELLVEFKNADERRARQAKKPARLFLREQSYAREASEGLLPVYIGIFQIYKGDEPDPLVCDSINAHRWRSPLRSLACKRAVQQEIWDDPPLAEELISGHTKSGDHTRQPHLAFVPLPSFSSTGKADGRVRRFALFGYATPDKVSAAASIYRTLAANLDGEEIEPGYTLQLIENVRRDKVWPLYVKASRVWITITPLAIARAYKVPTRTPDGVPLSSSERYLRRQVEWTKLVRASLRDILLPSDLVNSCHIQLTTSPLLAATERAERYRPAKEAIPFLHARIEFSKPVRGPLLVGDRRYQGFGLCAPVPE
jgi:CRISPR-associated protein Csb2